MTTETGLTILRKTLHGVQRAGPFPDQMRAALALAALDKVDEGPLLDSRIKLVRSIINGGTSDSD